MSSKSKGTTSGLGICLYFGVLFEANELTQVKFRITDSKIAEKVAKEFPGRKSAKAFVDGVRTVNDYRNRYNKGIFTHSIPPTTLSLRYDSDHDPVDGRIGARKLVGEEIRILRNNHNQFRILTLKEAIDGQSGVEKV